MKIKLFVAREFQYFEHRIFSFNSFVPTRAFNLPTRAFSVLTCEFELVTCRFELVAREFELVTHGFELVTRGFELVTRRFELVARGFELVTRNSSFTFSPLYVTKALRKAIMKRSQLEKIYFKKRTQESPKKYKKQKNYCSRLYKRERKSFFEGIDSSKITDNKTFWKNIQPFFSEKRKTVNKMTLVNENEDIASNDKVVADEISRFFKNATKNLGINENTYIVDNSNNITDPVNKAIDKFKNHPSILLIQSEVANDSTFSFNEASLSDIEKELRSLNPNKAYTFKNIPLKILKESRNVLRISCKSSLTTL